MRSSTLISQKQLGYSSDVNLNFDKKGPICMTEFLKTSKTFGMNFRKFRNHVNEFCRFEDARSIQMSSVVIKILKKLPIYQK